MGCNCHSTCQPPPASDVRELCHWCSACVAAQCTSESWVLNRALVLRLKWLVICVVRKYSPASGFLVNLFRVAKSRSPFIYSRLQCDLDSATAQRVKNLPFAPQHHRCKCASILPSWDRWPGNGWNRDSIPPRDPDPICAPAQLSQ